MQIRLTKTPHLAHGIRDLKYAMLAITIAIGFHVGLNWPFNISTGALTTMGIIISIAIIYALSAATELVKHKQVCNQLEITNQETISQSQINTISDLSIEIIKDILNIKDDQIAYNIWANIKPSVLYQIIHAPNYAQIDLYALIQHQITITVSQK